MKLAKRCLAFGMTLLILFSTMNIVVLADEFVENKNDDMVLFSYSTAYPNTHENTGNQAADIVAIAKTQVGYKENNDHTKYNDWFYDEDKSAAWCAIFISWCANEAGIKDSIIKKNAIASGYNKSNMNSNSFKTKSAYSFGNRTPKAGDIVYVNNDSDANSDHVGLVVDVTDTYIYTVEGNFDAAVTKVKYNRSDGQKSTGSSFAEIMFYAVPDYSSESIVVPSITSAKGDNHTEITVKWSKVSGATKYKVLRRQAGDSDYVTAKSSTTATTFTDTGLIKNQRYFYKVVAYNGSTEMGTSAPAGAYTKFNSPTIKAESTSKLTVSWDSVSYAESYTVKRRKSGDEEYSDIKTVTGTTYTDSGLESGIQYYYWIQANCVVDGTEITAKSTSAGQYTLTKAPAISSIDDTSQSEITIKWNAVSGATAYRVERRKSGTDTTYVTVVNSTTETSFKDSGLETGQRYYYRVYAINSGGESAASESVGGYTKFNAPSVSTANTTQLNLSWDSVAKAESYTIKRRRHDGEFADVKTVTGTTYTDSGLESGTQYYYWIQANCNVDGTKYVAKSTSKGQFTKLPAPSYAVNGQSVKLSWNAAKGDSSYTYKILRKEATAASYTTVTTTSSTTYTDSGLKADTTYYYYIDVLKNDNWCVNSDGITVKTPSIAVTGITLNKTAVTLIKGKTETLTATVAPSNATNKSVTWSSSNANIAKVENGVITAVGVGNAVITATAGGKNASCTVTVKENVISVTDIILSESTLETEVGASKTLTATVKPDNATEQTVIWSSSNDAVATVENGIVTAVSAGEAVITATAGGKSATCAVTVKEKVVIDEDAPKLYITEVDAKKGNTVTVDIVLENNTGFANLEIEFDYDETVLTLTEVSGNAGVGATFTKAPSNDTKPYNMSWTSMENVYYNGTLATLTFKVSEDAADGEHEITLSYYKGVNGNYTDGYDVNIDENFNAVGFVYQSGLVNITSHIPGDINGDGAVNSRDSITLLRHLAGWDVAVVEEAIDVNGDGAVNSRDSITLLRYLAGWEVEIY